MWIKLHESFLTGSTVQELKPDERAVFIELLLVAARCPTPGVLEVHPGIPWHPAQLANLLQVSAPLLRRACNRLVATEKLSVREDGCLIVTNWARYQPEYDRTKGYRGRRTATPNATGVATPVATASATPTGTATATTKGTPYRVIDHRSTDLLPPLVPPRASDGVAKGSPSAANPRDIDDAFLDEMASHFPELNVRDELERMRDYDKDKGRRHKDARAAFRNWLKKSEDFRRERAPPTGTPTANGDFPGKGWAAQSRQGKPR